MNNSKHLKRVLLNSIDTLCDKHREFLSDSNVNFTRTRKLTYKEIIKMLLLMESGPLKDELYNYFNYSLNTPTSSAFVQARNKISATAFEWLLKEFNRLTYSKKNNLLKGYRLIAVDGSDLLIRTDKNDIETYEKQISRNKDLENGYNAFHIIASYDLLEHTYDDLVIQPGAHKNEYKAFNQIVDRYKGEKSIFIADRGFGSYNNFAHIIHSGQKFLIRVKDLSSSNSMAKTLVPNPPDDEYDIQCAKILTYKATNTVKHNPQIYRWLPKSSHFDYLDEDNEWYLLQCRVVRFKISEDTYETIITNLDRNEFDSEEIKILYGMRWGIETSFRELKYAVDLNALHSKKHNSIKQEIYVRIIFYNFSERIIQKIKPRKGKIKRKHRYKINSTRAFHSIRYFLGYKKGGKNPPDIESIIANDIEPVRPGRSDPRKIRKQHTVYFIYRFN